MLDEKTLGDPVWKMFLVSFQRFAAHHPSCKLLSAANGGFDKPGLLFATLISTCGQLSSASVSAAGAAFSLPCLPVAGR